MRLITVLIVALLLTGAASGCFHKKNSSPSPTTTPTTSSPTNTTTSSPSPTPTNTTPPPKPPKNFTANLEFDLQANTPANGVALSLDSNGTRFEVKVQLKSKEATVPSTLQPEANKPKANVTLFRPGGVEKIDLDAITARTDPADTVLQTKFGNFTTNISGTWTVKVYGVGDNIKVAVTAQERFT